MNEQIIQAIDEEIARLQQVRAILTGGSAPVGRRPEKTKRHLSPKARRAIADAQRKRWAKVNSQKKAAAG